jgi:hypothetical protein
MRSAVVARLAATALVGLTMAVAGAVATPAAASSSFRPRIGGAMGLIPPLGRQETAASPAVPVVYHGGAVMRDVTLHTVFWAPAGHSFTGSPGAGAPGYQALVEQFLSDAARDSGTGTNDFGTLTQYGDGHGAGSYQMHYDPAVDSIDDTAPYPARSRQCASPSGVATCVTDLELQRQLDGVIARQPPGGRGLTNLWFVFLPADVDECTAIGSCATNTFAGYHSLFDLGHGATVYVAVPDPLVELTPPPGSDPEGNPEGESTLDTVAHETEEAITDPAGTGWMDPNGFEVADKCENGPEQGTPLGYAPDGSPYNQLIGGRPYLLQGMWSNLAGGCVEQARGVRAPTGLHRIRLRQFSAVVSGALDARRREPVGVLLLRGGTHEVASARTTTRADGSWGPVRLRGSGGVPHPVGDDRDVVAVFYGGAHSGPPDLIATADGGNPYTESGYTGWFELDHGYALSAHSIELAPCSQVGVLTLRVAAVTTEPPVQRCSTEGDSATLATPRIGPGTAVALTSEDNRAPSPFEPAGALVSLTIGLGEPGSVPALGNDQLPFLPSGFPVCTAFPRIGTVRCAGLVPGAGYRLAGHAARAGAAGVLIVSGLRLRGGDVLRLVNRAGRPLTALHVAHLRVAIDGDQTRVASGRCEPDAYYGAALSAPPVSDAVGDGIAGIGLVCPASGRAAGLPTADIAQTDEWSGGQTVIAVPEIESTAPIQDETLYGPFIASAQSGLPGPHGSVAAAGVPISLVLTRPGATRAVFRAANVDTARGVRVPALAPGSYAARWVLHDAVGDTRTLVTRFTDEPAAALASHERR